MKCCSKCNIEKDDCDFYSRRNVCKICEKEQQKQYYQNNAEVIREQQKQYYQNNAEAIKEQNKQYRQDNAEAIKEKKKQYRQDNAAAIKEQKKQYYQNNAKIIKEYHKQYRQDNAAVIKEQRKQYRQDNAEAIKEKQKQYRQNNQIKFMFMRAKHRAKQKNLPFNINEEDIVVPSMCPILRIPLETGIGKGLTQPNSPSLDRIIPEKGYVKGNIIVISNRANMIKQNATPEEIMEVGEYYKKLLEEAKESET